MFGSAQRCTRVLGGVVVRVLSGKSPVDQNSRERRVKNVSADPVEQAPPPRWRLEDTEAEGDTLPTPVSSVRARPCAGPAPVKRPAHRDYPPQLARTPGGPASPSPRGWWDANPDRDVPPSFGPMTGGWCSPWDFAPLTWPVRLSTRSSPSAPRARGFRIRVLGGPKLTGVSRACASTTFEAVAGSGSSSPVEQPAADTSEVEKVLCRWRTCGCPPESGHNSRCACVVAATRFARPLSLLVPVVIRWAEPCTVHTAQGCTVLRKRPDDEPPAAIAAADRSPLRWLAVRVRAGGEARLLGGRRVEAAPPSVFAPGARAGCGLTLGASVESTVRSKRRPRRRPAATTWGTSGCRPPGVAPAQAWPASPNNRECPSNQRCSRK